VKTFLDDIRIDVRRRRDHAAHPLWEWRLLHKRTGECYGEGASDAGFARACGDAMLMVLGQVEDSPDGLSEA
jgi:hypothetical protein